MQANESGKTIHLTIAVSYDADEGQIRMEMPGKDWFRTSVTPDAESMRGHPNLFAMLARCLREAEAPSPDSAD